MMIRMTVTDDPAGAPAAHSPWGGLALSLLSLAAGGFGLLWLLLSSYRGDGELAPLLLLGAALGGVYAGLWRILRCSTPHAHLRRLGWGLGLLTLALYGLGVPAAPLLAGLFLLALGVLAHSGPILFLAWVERSDARAAGRGGAARSS